MSRSLPAFVMGGAVLALDQGSKWWMLGWLRPGERKVIIPDFFDLVLVGNTGAAWGMFRSYGFHLTLLAMAALIVLLIIRRHFSHAGVLPRITLGLLLGGIAGNLTDRLIHGHVVDFLGFHLGKFHWPAFNVADSAICIGVGLYMIHALLESTKPGAPSSEEDSSTALIPATLEDGQGDQKQR